jgi:protein-S-isoprenylcysteine O-methyltransferase Ste14
LYASGFVPPENPLFSGISALQEFLKQPLIVGRHNGPEKNSYAGKPPAMPISSTLTTRRKTPSNPPANSNKGECTDEKRMKNHTLRYWLDVGIRIVLGVFFAFSAGIYFRNAFNYVQTSGSNLPLTEKVLNSFSLLAIGFYFFAVACLYVVRMQPINKFAGIVPTITALLAAFLIAGLALLHPRDDLPLSFKMLGAALILIGNIFAVVALNNLGRSFSILPEGRKLVMTGPYRYIRHPLYVAEGIATLGAMITFLSPAAVSLVAAQFALQLARIHCEEDVLRATFPEYEEYSRHTARLIPGIY